MFNHDQNLKVEVASRDKIRFLSLRSGPDLADMNLQQNHRSSICNALMFISRNKQQD